MARSLLIGLFVGGVVLGIFLLIMSKNTKRHMTRAENEIVNQMVRVNDAGREHRTEQEIAKLRLEVMQLNADVRKIKNELKMDMPVFRPAQPEPLSAPAGDLIVTRVEAVMVSSDRVRYQYEIKNIGEAEINLDGKTDEHYDNVAVQAVVSKDETFELPGDKAAGGTILGHSPLGMLAPGQTRTGAFSATVSSFDLSETPYLVLRVNDRYDVEEKNYDNNSLATRIRGILSEAFEYQEQMEDLPPPMGIKGEKK